MKIPFLKQEKKFKKEILHISPNVYWKISIAWLFVVFLASSFFGYYLFSGINKEPTPTETPQTTEMKIVKKERIDDALNYFAERKEKSAEIINFGAPVVDPSL